MLVGSEPSLYPEGTSIPGSVINRWFASDAGGAYRVALQQAHLLGWSSSPSAVNVLTSVIFQLGTGWPQELPTLWNLLSAPSNRVANYNQAVSFLRGLTCRDCWYHQSPTRVEDLIGVIKYWITRWSGGASPTQPVVPRRWPSSSSTHPQPRSWPTTRQRRWPTSTQRPSSPMWRQPLLLGVPSGLVYLLVQREGNVSRSYLASSRHLAGGVGHQLVGNEPSQYPLGTRIPGSVINRWFAADAGRAYRAALQQARLLGWTSSPAAVNVLASVVFQLGPGWAQQLPALWRLLAAPSDRVNNYRRAVSYVRGLRCRGCWYAQSPRRAEDLVGVINYWIRVWSQSSSPQQWQRR